MNNSEAGYDQSTQAIHWVSAAIIIVMIFLGIIMTRIEESPVRILMYRTHVTLGLIVLVLTVIRLVWLITHRWPHPPPELSRLRALAFEWNHILLYLILVPLLLSGIGMLLLSGLGINPVSVTPEAIQNVPPREAHHIFAKIFILLLIMHVGGVMQYQFRKGDVMSRMGIKWMSKFSPKKKDA